MSKLFISILDMSLTACIPIIVVFAMRALASRKAPKWTVCLLWALVGIKLVVPVELETELSLMNNFSVSDYAGSSLDNEAQNKIESNDFTEQSYSGEEYNNVQNVEIGKGEFSDYSDVNNSLVKIPVNTKNGYVSVIRNVWLCGTVLVLLYGLWSFISIKKRVFLFVEDEDGIRKCEGITSPFVFGIIRPKIYVPYNMNESAKKYIVSHEKAHIKRFDHITKIVAFFVLAIHWFNPFVWAAFIALSRDIEYACDEKVLSKFDDAEKKKYAYALLENSVKKTKAFSLSVPFGEIGAKKRIKNVFLNKFKNKAYVFVTIVALCFFSVCFMTEKPAVVSGDSNEQNNDYENGANDTVYCSDMDKEYLEEYLKNVIMSLGNNQPESVTNDGVLDNMLQNINQYLGVDLIFGEFSENDYTINKSENNTFLNNAQKTAEKLAKDKAEQEKIAAKYKEKNSYTTSGYTTSYSPYSSVYGNSSAYSPYSSIYGKSSAYSPYSYSNGAYFSTRNSPTYAFSAISWDVRPSGMPSIRTSGIHYYPGGQTRICYWN